MDISIKPIYPNNDDNQILAGSFKWMSLGLLISGLVSWFVASTPTLIQLIVGSSFGFIILIILELALVWYLSAKILTISKEAAHWLFIAYAILNGLTLSMIFFSYELTSIISIFFSTAIMFWLLGLYGSRTKKDLTSLGRLATFGLIGLIIAFVINIFIANSGLDLILSFVGVIIFTALTAYDVQKIKRLASSLNSNDSGRIVILGALTLYLDFVNLFLNLLRIFGRRK
jgi:hypothetical protein